MIPTMNTRVVGDPGENINVIKYMTAPKDQSSIDRKPNIPLATTALRIMNGKLKKKSKKFFTPFILFIAHRSIKLPTSYNDYYNLNNA